MAPIRALLSIVLLTLFVCLQTTSAQAAPPVLQVTVNGQAYNITMTEGSFNAVNSGGLLTSQPWWTSFDANSTEGQAVRDGIAADFRNAWNDAAVLAGALTDNETYSFAYANNSGSSAINGQAARWRQSLSGRDLGTTVVSPTTSSTGELGTLFYASAVAVPEIDGPLAAQAGFVFGSMLLWLRARRRRHTALS